MVVGWERDQIFLWALVYTRRPIPFHSITVSQVPLRPHTYYELTSGCELILADIQCQYFIGELPEEGAGSREEGGEAGGDYEQTQMYSFELEEEEAGTQSLLWSLMAGY